MAAAAVVVVAVVVADAAGNSDFHTCDIRAPERSHSPGLLSFWSSLRKPITQEDSNPRAIREQSGPRIVCTGRRPIEAVSAMCPGGHRVAPKS